MSIYEANDEMERLGWMAWKALGLCLAIHAAAGLGLYLLYRIGG